MLPFFRNKRLQLANNNQFLKYSRYAIGEIVLVVIGILIALQINNLNQDSKNRRIEQNYLIRIKESLINSQSEMDRVINKTSRVSNQSLKLVLLSRSKEYDLPYQTIDSLITSTGYTIYTPEEGIINEILNSDNLNLIRNDLIRSHIASWNSRQNVIKNYEDFIKTQTIMYGEFLSDYIDYSNKYDSVSIINPSKKLEFLSSAKLRYHLDLIRGMSNVVLQKYRKEKNVLDELEILVINELKAES